LPEDQRLAKLVEINVEEQVRRISRIPIVQSTWMKGKKLNIFGMVYDI
jgi:carbonic anhydrase